MKSFILNTFAFSSIVLLVFIIILSNADGYTDPFYIRFTTPKQENLILGTSRSAQGLQPQVFQTVLQKEFFNFSFSINHSPFGSVYLKSIKKKLNSNVRNGVFIISVDPWSISSSTEHPNDSVNFRENTLFLGTTKYINMNPNIEYLIENLKGKYYEALIPNENNMFLHNDGWLEVDVPMDSTSVTNRLKEKIKVYRKNNLPVFKFSSVRLNYLKETIEYLKLHGKAYLVRLPMHPEMFEIESELLPEFNEILAPVIQISDGYLDLTVENSLYDYTDGNHLYKESGKLVSNKTGAWIKKCMNQN